MHTVIFIVSKNEHIHIAKSNENKNIYIIISHILCLIADFRIQISCYDNNL